MTENGYETPRSLDNDSSIFDTGTNTEGERRRNGFGSSDVTERGSQEQLGTQDDLEGQNQSDQQGEIAIDPKKVGFRARVSCYTWTWFTMTMATGGIANVLHTIPYQSEWLRIIGVTFFLFNVTLFLLNCFFITLRFRWIPGSFKASFISPSESLFIPACVVSVGTILTNMSQYGIPYTGLWFQTAMEVLFWTYTSFAFVTSSGMYLILWSTQAFPISNMTPVWIFPAYPMLLVAPFAANLISALPSYDAAARINSVAIAFGAVCVQGTGFLVSLMIYSAFVYRLMTQKLPREKARPGMFVSVGPSGFTVAGFVTLGSSAISKIFPSGYDGNADAAFFFRLLSIMTGLWLWGLCLWFFLVSVGAHWQLISFGPTDPDHRIHFDMTWYSFVFPNTALVTATLAIGNSLESDPIKIFGTVLGVLVVIVWIIVFCLMLRALWHRTLLWPGQISGAEAIHRRWVREGSDALIPHFGIGKIFLRPNRQRPD